MQAGNRIIDEVTQAAGGALGLLAGAKSELDILVRQKVERLFTDMNMVPRDEFEAVKAMVAQARAENDALRARIEDLEKKVFSLDDSGSTPSSDRNDSVL